MADLVDTIIVDDRPIAVRKTRRISTANSVSRNNVQFTASQRGISTPPATPKRTKKRVRFSDPGPAIEFDSSSSGLTPFIRRASLSTPKTNRRHSTPTKLWNLADSSPLSGELQFAPLRQVLDGRVKRRLRRNRLSEEINIIELDKKEEAKGRRSEVERLRKELAAKDLEVQNMRDEQDIASQIEGEAGGSFATNSTLSSKVQELEHQILHLKAELARKESDPEEHNWTMAAKDPFDMDNDDDDMMITNYDDDDFHDGTEMITTPARLNTSFPSPPSTMPNTPSVSIYSMNAGIQTSPDPDSEALKAQLRALQEEISKLNAAIALTDDNTARLTSKLSDFISSSSFSQDHATLDSALDKVLTQLALSQSYSLEQSTRYSALTNEIHSLHFAPPTTSLDDILTNISSQFRKARLELEYLTPGEIPEGFENSKLLDMLVSRVKTLLEEKKERDQSIDQYHEQEISLRQQLNARCDAMDSLRTDLSLSTSMANELRADVHEKDVDNERLRSALEGYRSEVSSLEALISSLDAQNKETETTLRGEIGELNERLMDECAKHDTTTAEYETKERIVLELESKLQAALKSASEVQAQLDALKSTVASREIELSSLTSTLAEKDTIIQEKDNTISSLQQSSGAALALRDARVTELRNEIDRINESLKNAHNTILSLRQENGALQSHSQNIVSNMLSQLSRAASIGNTFINGNSDEITSSPPALVRGGDSSPIVMPNTPAGLGMIVRKGGLFDGSAARRNSGSAMGKKRRRYDSGLGFLEEGEEEVEF